VATVTQPPPGSAGPDPGASKRIAYLPPKAFRARKLILRTQLGLPWLLGAVVVAGAILVAGVLFLVRSGHPSAPWARLGPATGFAPGAVSQTAGPAGSVVVVDRRDGVRAFLAERGPCPVEAAGGGFARPCDGARWDLAGSPAPGSGAATMHRVPAQLSGGDIWVDPTG
jgi:hypothetical protein